MEDAQQTQASGTLDVSDVDTALTEGQRRFNAQTDVAGTYGTFTLGPDGAWTYTLHNTDEDTDALGAGQGEDGGVHGHEPGRHHRARGGHGDGCGRRGGDWGRADGVGDGGCAADAGERDA